jgi:hypothetical protein
LVLRRQVQHSLRMPLMQSLGSGWVRGSRSQPEHWARLFLR